MARVLTRDMRVHFGGYDIGTATTRVAMFLGVDSLDRTAFTDGAERVQAGMRRDRIEWAGLYDDDNSHDAAMSSLIGSSNNNVVSLLIGTATGDIAYVGTALLTLGKPTGEIAGLVRQEGAFQPDNQFLRGVHYGTATNYNFSIGGNSGTHDNTAATTAGGTLFMHAFGSVTTGSGSVTLEDSADGTTFAAIGTRVEAVTARTAQRVNIGGTIRRYTRLGAVNGTGTLGIVLILVRA